MTDRYDSLMPRDLLITLRSLPRRFDTVHNSATKTSEIAARTDQPGPSGLSLRSLVNDAVCVVSAANPAVSTTLTADSPTVELYELGTQSDNDLSVKQSVVAISEGTAGIADRLNDISADDWNRTATVTGAGPTTLVDIVRGCVRSCVELLRSAERQVEWMQTQ